MAIIDLGEVHEASPDLPVRPGTARRAWIVLAAVLVLLTGGSIPPAAEPVLHFRWDRTMPEQYDFSLAGDVLYVASAAAGGRTALTAVDLATGATRWSRTVPRGGAAAPEPLGDRILLRTDLTEHEQVNPDGSTAFTQWSRTTVGLDTESGAVRWRVPGEAGYIRPYAGSVSTALLQQYDDKGRLRLLRMIRLSDGTEVWRQPATGPWTVVFQDDRPSEILLAGAGGRIDTLRWADGRPVRTGRLPGTPVEMGVVAGRLVTYDRGSALVYRLGDLTRLWGGTGLTGCGPNLCTATDTDLIARDPDTGAERWRHPGMQAVQSVAGSRLLLTGGGQSPALRLVDGRTGKMIVSVAGQAAWPGADPDAVLVSQVSAVTTGYTDGPVTVHATAGVIRLDMRTGRMIRVGALPEPVEFRCATTGAHLVCPEGKRLVVRELSAG